MSIGANTNVITQLGVESTPGTPATITKKLRSFSIDFDTKATIKEFQPMGVKFATVHIKNQEWSEAKVTGVGAYNELQYALSSAFRTTTPTAVLVGSAFAGTHLYSVGDFVRPGNGHIYIVTVGGTSGGSAPTFPTTPGSTVVSGTVTFQEDGSDVSGATQWVFDISSEGLDTFTTYTFETGDVVRSRGRKSAYAVLKDFGLTSKRTGDCSISGTFLGRILTAPAAMTTSGITENPMVPISTQQVNVYLDTTSSGIGTTQLTENFDIGINLKDRYAPAWVHDRNQSSFLQVLTRDPKLEIDLTIADDTPLDSTITNLNVGQRMFIRFEAVGNAISPGVNYTFQWDVAAQISAAWSYGNEGEARIAKLKLGAEHDGTWTRATQAKLINAVATL